MSDSDVCLEVDRSQPGTSRLHEQPPTTLEAQQVRFRIERFALTANNVTYAVAGDMLGYWDFFPASEGWGRVPAVGWAEVVESAHPDVPVGGRYSGWFPMARSVDMTVSPQDDGLRDEGAHRSAHAPIYRAYRATDRDPFYVAGADAEDRHSLLRVLFLTAFLADDFFADQAYAGARRAIVISASSKTAIGFAHCARARGVEVVGLTSAANVAFVDGLGCYDRVVPYAEVETIATDADAVSIDMAGNGPVLERVHEHLGDRLKHSMIVGLSHHDAPRASAPKGPTPELFFAPTQVAKRVAEWGADGYQSRIAEALEAFVAASRRWLTLQHAWGPQAVRQAWSELVAGRTAPSVGQIASLWDDPPR